MSKIQVLDLFPNGRCARRCKQAFGMIDNEKVYDCYYSRRWLSWKNLNFRRNEVLYYLHIAYNSEIKRDKSDSFGEYNFVHFEKECKIVSKQIEEIGFAEILLQAHVYFNQSDKELAIQRANSFAVWRLGENDK